jgi:4'-phosphopantetheinyl transferase
LEPSDVQDQTLRIFALRVDGLTEADVAPWRPSLDADEIARADRFVFPNSRIEFTSAHALTRWALGQALGVDRRAFRFVAGGHGKPEAWLGDAPAPVSFNLTHTKGIVAVAVSTTSGLALGVDFEPIDRTVDLKVADSYFGAREVAWLMSQPDAQKPEGFLRLWTLKESFIKATGKGLTQDLASFGFEVEAERIYFTEDVPDDPAMWCFQQRLVENRFLGAVGWRRPETGELSPEWRLVVPEDLPTD